MKATRLVLLAVGVVAVGAVAKKWLTPGGVYVPEVHENTAEGLATRRNPS